MQIKIEQTMADIRAFINRKQLPTEPSRRNESPIARSESNEEKITQFQIERKIQEKLGVEAPKPSFPPLESNILPVKAPFYVKHQIEEQLPIKFSHSFSHDSPRKDSHYKPLNRYFPEDPYQDVTKSNIDKFGLLELQNREEVPRNLDLSPAFKVPAENGKELLIARQKDPTGVRELDEFRSSPARSQFSQLQLYKLEDPNNTKKEHHEEQKKRNDGEKLVADATVDEAIRLQSTKRQEIQHWNDIDSDRYYNTNMVVERINKHADVNEFELANPLYFYDIEEFKLEIEGGQIVENIVYKALLQKYWFCRGEINYLLSKCVGLAEYNSYYVAGEEIAEIALEMYFENYEVEIDELREIMQPREKQMTPEEIKRLAQAKERQQELDAIQEEENEELKEKVVAALHLEHFFKYKQTRARYTHILEEQRLKDEESFCNVEEEFQKDIQPYYNRLSDYMNGEESTVERTIDIPLLDVKFWHEMRGREVDQKFLIFAYYFEDRIQLFSQLGCEFEETVAGHDFSDSLLALLIDPRVYLTVVTPFDLKVPRTYMFNVCDAVNGRLGDAEDRFSIVSCSVDDYQAELARLVSGGVPCQFVFELKSCNLRLLQRLQREIDRVQPDLAFSLLSPQQEYDGLLVELVKSLGLPIHQYCSELLSFQAFNERFRQLNNRDLVLGYRGFDFGDEESADGLSESKTYLLRPDLMVTAPGEDLLFGEVGGIGIAYYLKRERYQIFQNLDFGRFYRQYGAVLQEYHQEAAILRYCSYAMTAGALAPRFYYEDLYAKSYVNFGRTMSAGSYSAEQSASAFGSANAYALKQLVAQLQKTVAHDGAFRGTFEVGFLLYKQDGYHLEFNQLLCGYSDRYLQHLKQEAHNFYLLANSAREDGLIKQNAQLQCSQYLFMLNCYNMLYKEKISKLVAQKVDNTYLSVRDKYALDIIVSGQKTSELIGQADSALSKLQNISGGEEQMREILGSLASVTKHEIQSIIERTGTAAFYVCAINTYNEAK